MLICAFDTGRPTLHVLKSDCLNDSLSLQMCSRMTVWQTPAGIVDEGGMVLQAWLNFGITLVAPPANGLMHVRTETQCL